MSSSAMIVRPHPRAFPERMHEWHQRLYEAAQNLTQRLESLPHRPILSDNCIRHLDLEIIRDRLDVDNEPVDNQPVNNQHIKKEPVDNEPFNNQPFRNQSIKQEPVDNEPVNNQPVRNVPSMIPRFFEPDDPHAAAQRVQRWNEVKRWPAPDPHKPEFIQDWRGYQIRTDIPLFDDIEHNFHRCCSMLMDRAPQQGQPRDSRDDGPEHQWVKFRCVNSKTC